MGHTYDGSERRKYLRLPKNFSMSFHLRDTPNQKSDETRIKDIGKGGLLFTSSRPLKIDSHLFMELNVPYIAPKKAVLEGFVVACKEISARMVFEIRVKFIFVDKETYDLLDMIEKRTIKGL